MGRLPKGFKKTLQHKPDAPGGQPAPEATAQPATPASKPKEQEDDLPNPAFLKGSAANTEPAAKSKQGSSAAQAAHSSDESEDEGASTSGQHETRGQMIKRHQRELQAFKKNIPRMGKKSKEEVAKLTAELEAKHAKELAELAAREAGGEAGEASKSTPAATATASSSAQAGVAALSLEDPQAAGVGKQAHMTKAMKRRQKAAEAEAEREARIAAEAEAAGPSAREVEEEQLFALLAPLGLKMREIRADGHCLYRSLEDQLNLLGGDGVVVGPKECMELRRAAAQHMRQHPDEYAAFVDTQDGETPEQALERHCREVEDTPAWGGQLELSVLAQVLKRPIRVYSVGLGALTIGEEYEKPGVTPLQVCYLRHAFGLGEHYNSLETAAS